MARRDSIVARPELGIVMKFLVVFARRTSEAEGIALCVES